MLICHNIYKQNPRLFKSGQCIYYAIEQNIKDKSYEFTYILILAPSIHMQYHRLASRCRHFDHIKHFKTEIFAAQLQSDTMTWKS